MQQHETIVSLSGELKNTITINQAWHYKIIPRAVKDGVLYLMINEQFDNPTSITELEIVLGKPIKVERCDSETISRLLQSFYPKANADFNALQHNTSRLNVHADNFLGDLISEAKSLNSSDIHIETYGDKNRIRFRVDGQLIDRHKLNKTDYPTLINKIKIAAACDIAEKRLPQDGRIRYTGNSIKIDIRVSILPTLYGEKIVLRLLGSDASHIEIEKLGFQPDELDRYKLAVQKPNGIILISGPTGSGKTTTLYATLKQLNRPTSNIMTIEDPVEYTLDGINQVQLKEDIGLGYSEALRTFLRQDPDIIMLGEIRDKETAQMAIRAALTGHLVLSTIHTNSAWGTISRLMDMGVPGYLLANTLNLTVAQRLVRTLCSNCKEKKTLNVEELPSAYKNIRIEEQFVPNGCGHCHYTGYKGRKAIYEVINLTKELSEEIKQNATNIDNYCREYKIKNLSENALRLFLNGETSLEEIYPFLINES